MAARSTWSRILSLEGVAGSPAESRAFLQRRVATFFAVIAAMGWLVYAIALVVLATRFGPHMVGNSLVSPLRLMHVGVNVAITAAAVYTGRGERTLGTLNVIDGVGNVAMLTVLALMLVTSAGRYASEYELLIVFVIILTARAAVVPSEPLRTLAIGAVGACEYVAAAWAVVGTVTRPGGPATNFPLIIVIVWAVIAVGVTTMVSREIYGLHKKVEAAAQLGQYTLQEKIGEGGMGIVYRASHAMLRRPTAIKLLPPDRMGAAALARFEREVQVTARLTHPNTVAIYDYGRTPDGVFYYAMEYLEGLDVHAIVDLDGPQPEGRVVHLLHQAAGALAEAHHAGLVHRDVKPANLVVCERGGARDFVKVVDFGLVKSLDRTDPASSAEGGVVGTPLYMAPEAVAAPDDLDARSDVYALGAVGYWLLTGAPPFEGRTAVEVLARALHDAPIPPSDRANRDVHPELEALVLECLAKDPSRRPRSATELGARLEALAASLPWTREDADAWWNAHATHVAARAANRSSTAVAATVLVDVRARASA